MRKSARGVLAIAEVSVSQVKDLSLPGVVGSKRHASAVLVKRGERISGIGIVIQAKRTGAA